jgi:hypothetical protein
MPSLLRITDLSGDLDMSRLAKRYPVSQQAMWIQLIELKLASQYARV